MLRKFTYFQPGFDRGRNYSVKWAICCLGAHHGEICPSASEVRSLGGYPLPPSPPMPSTPVDEGVRSAWTRDMWSGPPWFLGPGGAAAKDNSLHVMVLGKGLGMASNMSSKSSSRYWDFVCLFVGFVFVLVLNAFKGIVSSLSETIPPKWLSLALAGKPLLDSLKQEIGEERMWLQQGLFK